MKSRRSSILQALSVVVAVSAAGCAAGLEDRVKIRSRLRLGPSRLEWPSATNVLRYAVQAGRWPVEVRLRDFDVRKGQLTLHGADGSVSLTTNGLIAVRMNGYQDLTFRLAHMHLNLDLRRCVIDISPGVEAGAVSLWLDQTRMEDRRSLSPRLKVASVKDGTGVDVPYSLSVDFEGEIGVLEIRSNWYDGPDSGSPLRKAR
jgi:hypothetical protein